HTPRSTLFPYTTLFRSHGDAQARLTGALRPEGLFRSRGGRRPRQRGRAVGERGVLGVAGGRAAVVAVRATRALSLSLETGSDPGPGAATGHRRYHGSGGARLGRDRHEPQPRLRSAG